MMPARVVLAMSGGSPLVPKDFLPDAVALGAAAALPKPFGTAQLLGAVRGVLAG